MLYEADHNFYLMKEICDSANTRIAFAKSEPEFVIPKVE